MKLFYKQIEITTKLSKAEVALRLKQVVFADNKEFDYSLIETMPVVFKGVVGEDAFRIKRMRRLRDAGIPIITGAVNENLSNTSVKIEMRLRPIDSVFFYFQATFFTLFFIGWVIYSLLHANFGARNFLPLIAIAIGSTLMITTFNQESLDSEKYLRRLFGAEVTK